MGKMKNKDNRICNLVEIDFSIHFDIINELHCEKTCLQGFRPGPTQTGLYIHRRWLDA